jgi:hypothetical protein
MNRADEVIECDVQLAHLVDETAPLILRRSPHGVSR